MATVVSYEQADGGYSICTDDHRQIHVAPDSLVIVRDGTRENCDLGRWYWWLEVYSGVLYLNQRSRDETNHFSLLTPYGAIMPCPKLTEFVRSANNLLPLPPLPAAVYPS